ncbi:uncharacterized protein BKCO1_1000619 [Diplodia corticola]|uniref:Uncharacterized protein n=1 Tax=Diplodia corticola TaxID=236234 RepID=A0A1J9RFG3_9PEZI|nr:uncharacterized protein BKCO1_1000619 [Diplodia corticola]OJD40270.1 hypothetical protein BKCO1_1000619 [Diplodia corticola]
MNFAPYQDASPENTRALSPPPLRSPTHSPRPSLSTSRPSGYNYPHHQRGLSAASATSPSGYTPSGYTPSGYTNSNASYFPPATRGSSDLERGWGNSGAGGWGQASASRGSVGGREDLDLFETRLGIRMDWEACLAYLLLPPAGGVLLLVVEHRSDYVRFHAWQSALLFSFMFVMHIIFSFSSVVSWLLFVVDLGAIGYLTMRAYRDAETLDRCEVPLFGRLASSILDDE